MANIEELLDDLRAAAGSRGPQWLQEQVSILLGNVKAGTASPALQARRSRRSVSLERLSP